MKRTTRSLIVAFTISYIFCIFSCTVDSTVVPESEYSSKIVGHWEGTVNSLEEEMTLKSDNTFVCKILPTGFIAKTLSQGIEGSVKGTWKITGKKIMLTIPGEEHENVINTETYSTIESFKEDELILKSDLGETSTFLREITF